MPIQLILQYSIIQKLNDKSKRIGMYDPSDLTPIYYLGPVYWIFFQFLLNEITQFYSIKTRQYIMKFKTIDIMSKKLIYKGKWKPLFKSRLYDKYNNDKMNYEEILRQKIFEKTDSEIVIIINGYPFNLGPDLIQYVVWIRNKDPGIMTIQNIVESTYPNTDYIIYENTYENKSIKSIIHYHLILRVHVYPSYSNLKLELNKLIIYNRHAHRYPIAKIPRFESMLGNIINGLSYDHNANLLPIGHELSSQFGFEIKNIYQLNYQFIKNCRLISSPIRRCKDTLYAICEGLGLEDFKINIDNNLFIDFISQIKNMENTINFKAIRESTNNLLEKFMKHENTKINGFSNYEYLLKLYDYTCSFIAYQDLGIDVKNLINQELYHEMMINSKIIYNLLSDIHFKIFEDKFKSIINDAVNCPNNLIIGSTHDIWIFSMLKYLCNKNNLEHLFEVPEYLANIRIEKWNDGVIRIFYNNYYLGNYY